jgi:hypothetical protein
MRDRNVRLARLHSEGAADVPGAREIRVEREGTVDQCHHGADVLAKIGQRLGSIREDARVVARHFEGSPGEINTLQTVRRRIVAATVKKQPKTAIRGPGEREPVTRVARNRLFRKRQRVRDLPRRRPDHCADGKTVLLLATPG